MATLFDARTRVEEGIKKRVEAQGLQVEILAGNLKLEKRCRRNGRITLDASYVLAAQSIAGRHTIGVTQLPPFPPHSTKEIWACNSFADRRGENF
ncbi:hypothetical protein [Lacipirellula parvula]|uniref:hypothetical protein n=1 Tax=Lacipirellula parvula TaxID=2650471 RepID=UPI00126129C6|nr:hypothetical protein [Lacipirellula parvula]